MRLIWFWETKSTYDGLEVLLEVNRIMLLSPKKNMYSKKLWMMTKKLAHSIAKVFRHVLGILRKYPSEVVLPQAYRIKGWYHASVAVSRMPYFSQNILSDTHSIEEILSFYTIKKITKYKYWTLTNTFNMSLLLIWNIFCKW